MTIGTVCSGIGGIELGFQNAGFTPIWSCEIDKLPRSVLERHWPNIPHYHDMTKLPEDLVRPTVVAGGTPCVGFSLAGLRKSLDDERSNLALEFVRIADRLNPEYIVFENVAGVLSVRDNAFGCLLGALAGHDAPLLHPDTKCFRDWWREHEGIRYPVWPRSGMVTGPKREIAWRVFCSQYFGLAQRRERVVVVASTRAGSCSELLFERFGVQRNSPPSRTPGQDIASTLGAGAKGGFGGDLDRNGAFIPEEVAFTLRQDGGMPNAHNSTLIPTAFVNTGAGYHTESEVACSLRTQGEAVNQTLIPTHEVAPCLQERDSKGQDSSADKAMVVAFDTTQITSKTKRSNPQPNDPCHPLTAEGQAPVIAFDRTTGASDPEISNTLRACSARTEGVNDGKADTSCVAFQPSVALGKSNPSENLAPTLQAGSDGDHQPCVATGMGAMKGLRVRRLTPTEAARISGFSDDWADGLSDAAKYRAFGNCCNVPVFEWVARRIKAFHETR